MTERPILFSAPMVRAILDGRKTQTRRVVKKLNDVRCELLRDHGVIPGVCQYGQPGDRLWVRETWSPDATSMYPCPSVWYRASDDLRPGADHDCPKHKQNPWADCLACWEEAHGRFRWRPSIFMPRKFSRITLEIASVRVERLQEISEEDAKAEGVREIPDDESEIEFDRSLCPRCGGTMLYVQHSMAGARFDVDCDLCDTFKKRYAILWESINGPGSWDANPFVWVVEFRRLQS